MWLKFCVDLNKILEVIRLLVMTVFFLCHPVQDTVDWGRKWLVDFNTGKTQQVLFDWSNNTGTIDVKMDRSVLEEK